MNRKKSGCRNLMFIPIVDGAHKIEDKIDLKGLLENFDYKANYKECSNYADNEQNIYKKKLSSYDITIQLTELGLKNKGKIFGKKYNKGGLATTSEDQAVSGAIILEETYVDNSFERVIFYNVTLYDADQSNQSDSDNFNFAQQGLTGKALGFAKDGKIYFDYRMDSADPDLDKTKFDNFYTKVQFEDDTTI